MTQSCCFRLSRGRRGGAFHLDQAGTRCSLEKEIHLYIWAEPPGVLPLL